METANSEAFIVTGFFGAGFALCLTASSPYHWLGGFGAWGIGEALRYKRRITYTEVWRGSADYLKGVIGEVGEVAAPLTDSVDGMKTRIVTDALKQLPMGERLADRYLAGQGVTADWFNGFEKRSAVVCGESRDGKTHILLWRVQRFLEANPQATIMICDPDYGSSHEGSKPNNWFGLPLSSVIQSEADEITAAILSVSEEVSSRAKATKEAIAQGKEKPQFKPLLLVCDEWVSYWGSLSKDIQEQVKTALANIMNRGIKQGGVTFLLGLHDLSVGSTGLSMAVLAQLETVLLRRASQRTANYQNLGCDRREVDQAINRSKLIPTGKRVCVVWSDKELHLREVPSLAIGEVELIAPGTTDPDEQWLEATWTPEFELQLIREKVTGIKKAWTLTGETSKMLNTNPRYVLFKNRFTQYRESQSPDFGNQELTEGTAKNGTDTESEFQAVGSEGEVLKPGVSS